MNLALPASLIFSNPQCELSEITLKELEIFQSARIPNSPDRIPQARPFFRAPEMAAGLNFIVSACPHDRIPADTHTLHLRESKRDRRTDSENRKNDSSQTNPLGTIRLSLPSVCVCFVCVCLCEYLGYNYQPGRECPYHWPVYPGNSTLILYSHTQYSAQ